VVAADERQRPEGGDAAERRWCRNQNLAAPDRAVGSVARAVVSDSNRWPGQAVLGHGAHNVRVMMLHRDPR
jgi:hypothetical protein